MTREEAIKYLEKADVTVYQEPKTRTAEALEMAIKALQEQKVGKWIRGGHCCGDTEWKCSVCGADEWRTNATPFCMWCGAKMEGTDNGSI